MCRERQTLDFVQSQIHPTVFLHRRGETLEGMRGAHVDDDLMAGSIGSRTTTEMSLGNVLSMNMGHRLLRTVVEKHTRGAD